MSKHNRESSERYMNITQARKALNQLVEDPYRETLIMRDGVPAAMLVGIETWTALHDLLGLLQHPDLLARSLAKHHAFQTGKPEDAMALEELSGRIAKDVQQSDQVKA